MYPYYHLQLPVISHPDFKNFFRNLFGFSLGLLINFLASMIGGLLGFFHRKILFRETIIKMIGKNKIALELERSLNTEDLNYHF